MCENLAVGRPNQDRSPGSTGGGLRPVVPSVIPQREHPLVSKTGAFEFVDGGRNYSCRVEEASNGRAEAWWWFGVAGDTGRYAPFRADDGDTESSVRTRIVAYYEGHLARRGWIWRTVRTDGPARI